MGYRGVWFCDWCKYDSEQEMRSITGVGTLCQECADARDKARREASERVWMERVRLAPRKD